MSEPKYKRVLLKLSGEALAGNNKTGVDVETVGKICDKIKEITEMGVEVGIVCRWRKFLERKKWTSNGKSNSRLHGNACNNYEFISSSRYDRK